MSHLGVGIVQVPEDHRLLGTGLDAKREESLVDPFVAPRAFFDHAFCACRIIRVDIFDERPRIPPVEASGAVLLVPRARSNHRTLGLACIAVFLSIWIDKGLGLVITGFIPSPFGKVIQYWPTLPETLIALGIWAIGVFFITIFYKMALSIRREIEA